MSDTYRHSDGQLYDYPEVGVVDPDLLATAGNEMQAERGRLISKDGKRACTHPPGCTFCAWCGFDIRDTVARLDNVNAAAKRSAEIGDYPYVPRKWSLEDHIRDQYFAPGTRFTLVAEIELDERGGIRILSTAYQSVVPGTFIDPAP